MNNHIYGYLYLSIHPSRDIGAKERGRRGKGDGYKNINILMLVKNNSGFDFIILITFIHA